MPVVELSLFFQADGKKNIELKSNCLFEHDKSVGAVIVGLDQYINFYKLQYATLCIRENPGCLFIATNRDAVGHLTDLQEWPGAGCMVAAVCGTTQKEPITVGKPSTFLMDFLLQKYTITTSRMCMVGDRLDTDILFGQNAGCRTLLVFSVLAVTLLWKNIQTFSLTGKLFPAGFFAAISAPMFCFYSYVILSGGNPPPKKLKASASDVY